MAEKTITLDRGAFMGKKDYTLNDYLAEWKSWALQMGSICNKTEHWELYEKLLEDTKALATIQFEKMYQDQQTVNKPEYNKQYSCLLYTSPSPRDRSVSRMPSSA